MTRTMIWNRGLGTLQAKHIAVLFLAICPKFECAGWARQAGTHIQDPSDEGCVWFRTFAFTCNTNSAQ